jgi:hypothetical protein
MKAITIHQPWATLIAIGAKRFETRSWAAEDYRGPLAIHAGRNTESLPLFWDEPFCAALQAAGYENPESLPLGSIVCVATLEDCLRTNGMAPMDEPEASFGNFDPDRFMWALASVKRFDPIKARGYQKIWDWDPPPEIVALVEGREYKKPNRDFWVTGPKSMCVFAADEADARAKCAAAGVVVTSIGTLPYPASPQLNPEDNTSGCPPFCYDPSNCVGNGSCRKSYACTE